MSGAAAEDFRLLVARMHEAQRSYFRTRSQSALRESKRLEALVDAQLPTTTGAEQGQLFGGRS